MIEFKIRILLHKTNLEIDGQFAPCVKQMFFDYAPCTVCDQFENSNNIRPIRTCNYDFFFFILLMCLFIELKMFHLQTLSYLNDLLKKIVIKRTNKKKSHR